MAPQFKAQIRSRKDSYGFNWSKVGMKCTYDYPNEMMPYIIGTNSNTKKGGRGFIP